MKLIDIVESKRLRNPGSFQVGDTVDVHVKIIEGNKERIQLFSGVVISRRGKGLSESFKVRRIVAGEGVERSFPLHSPRIDKIEVRKKGRVRRAKLYYMRDRSGKSTRLKEIMGLEDEASVAAPAQPEAVVASGS
ncbi:MAG: 50S ribosomal protein L19 [Planctomycetota bacterium]